MIEFQMGDAESTRHSCFTRWRFKERREYIDLSPGPGKCVLVFSVYGRGMESTWFDGYRVNNQGKNPAPPVT